jgi:hypothetical protein
MATWSHDNRGALPVKKGLDYENVTCPVHFVLKFWKMFNASPFRSWCACRVITDLYIYSHAVAGFGVVKYKG